MQVQTLLPSAARHEIIGGPGREFWTNGRNWEIPNHEERLAQPGNQYGRYRLEVSPAGDGEKTRFLHVMQVGPASRNATLQAELVRTETQDGVELECPETQRRHRVLFNRDGLIGGHLHIRTADGETLLDQPLLDPAEPVAHTE